MSGSKSHHRKFRRGCLKVLIVLLLVFLSCTLVTLATILAVLNHFSQGLPDVSRLRYYEPSETTRIYAADGSLIATLYKENRTWTPLEEISPHMMHALLAIEDSRFYQHRGVDPVGVIRAAYRQARHESKEGASTVTMQLAQQLFLTDEISLARKIRQALLAMQIERRFTKDEILELYLNQVYFGAGAYGVRAASNLYFAKKPKDLTITEASLLAGLPQKPTEFSPLVNPEASHARQRQVLGRMLELKYITEAEYRQALDEMPRMKFQNTNRKEFQIFKLPYFTDYVIKELYKRYDEDLLYRGGLRIHTTVDPRLQKKCEELLKSEVNSEGTIFNFHTGAVVVIENGSGYIRALVGGTGWNVKNQFNRAFQAFRQPGSSFKLFVYTAAMESGMTPETVVPDSPVTYTLGPGESYSPQNSDGRFIGAVPLKTALQFSRNVVAVKLLVMLGPERIIDYCYRMGVHSKLEPVLSLALGACDISPLEMATAYSVVANGGIRIDPSPIKIIYDSEGNIVEDHRFPHHEEVLCESTAYYMTDMLMNAAHYGTGAASYIEGRDCAGKTGTTTEHKDIWFCGFTPQFTAVVWVGNDDHSQMYGVFGGDICAPLWKRVMTECLKGKPSIHFNFRKGDMLPVLMCSASHKRAGPHCPKVYREFFRPGGLPYLYCDAHGARPLPNVATGPAGPSAPTKPTTAASPTDTGTDVLGLPGAAPTPVEIPLGDMPAAGPEPVPVDPGAPVPDAIPAPAPMPVEIPMEAPPEPQPVEPAPAPEPVTLPEPGSL